MTALDELLVEEQRNLINAQRERIAELEAALACLFDSYKALADSGDAGFWALEDQDEGKVALAALRR